MAVVIDLSLPAVVNRHGISEVLRLVLDKKEQGDFVRSAEALQKVIKETGI